MRVCNCGIEASALPMLSHYVEVQWSRVTEVAEAGRIVSAVIN